LIDQIKLEADLSPIVDVGSEVELKSKIWIGFLWIFGF